MIIGESLREVFKGMALSYEYRGKTIDTVVQYHHGSQKELNNWIIAQNNGRKEKYPLIWYVRDSYTEINDQKNVNARIILFNITEYNWFNDERAKQTYLKILDPLYKMVSEKLKEHPFVSVYSSDKEKLFDMLDEPNYGVANGLSKDFSSTGSNQTESIAIDIVDAKIIDFKMRIKTNCILK